MKKLSLACALLGALCLPQSGMANTHRDRDDTPFRLAIRDHFEDRLSILVPLLVNNNEVLRTEDERSRLLTDLLGFLLAGVYYSSPWHGNDHHGGGHGNGHGQGHGHGGDHGNGHAWNHGPWGWSWTPSTPNNPLPWNNPCLPVPEPEGLALMGSGLIALAALRRRKG